MNDTKVLIEKIKEGIQEKKGKNIIIADLTNIEDTICKYFVICQGNSPSQVGAIVDSIKEFTRKGADSKPFAVDGLRNAEWVAMDYAETNQRLWTIIVATKTIAINLTTRLICPSST